MKVQNIITLKKAGIHFSIWLLLILTNILFVKSFSFKVHIVYHIFFWLIYAILFYVNYLLLMPKYFLKKKFILYILSSVLLLLIAFYIKRNMEFVHMQKLISDNIEMTDEDLPIPSEEYCFDTRPSFDDHPRMPEHKFRKSVLIRERRPIGPMSFFFLYGLVLIYTASISISLMQKWKNDEKRRSEIEKENIFTELSFLKQQINPHFLFNALNNVYSLTLKSSKPASEAILKLSSILRYMLYETENKLVKLKNELDIIKNYIALQKLRLTKSVLVKFEIEGNAGSLTIVPLLLLPIIENAFKYGADNVNDSFIRIHISIYKNQIELLVKNKVVDKQLGKKDKTGIGLKNIKRRLDLLYPGNYVLVINQEGYIFSVHLQLNLQA